MKILIRSPNWIGDQILSYPFYYALRKAYPEAEITTICVPWVKELQFKKQVDQVYVHSIEKGQSFVERVKALEETAKNLKERGPWDLGISLPNSLSAAWILFRSDVKIRRGYRQDGRGFLLNDAVSWAGIVEKQGHRAQSYLNLIPEASRPKWTASEFWPRLPSNELDSPLPGVMSHFEESGEWGVDSQAHPVSLPSEFWVLAPGSTAESRRWSMPSFVSLARLIHSHTGIPGIIMGGVSEVKTAQALSQDRSACLKDYTMKVPLPATLSLLRRAKFVVCNESGFAHLAALSGVPTHIICGAADPKRTQPLGPGKVQISINPVECWPCERNVCLQPAESQLQCLRGISPERVFEELKVGFKL